MPNTKTAKKELRKNIRRRLLNKSQISAVKTAVKKCRLSLAKDLQNVDTAFIEAQKKLAKAGRKGLIPVQRVSRLISNLSKKCNAAKSGML